MEKYSKEEIEKNMTSVKSFEQKRRDGFNIQNAKTVAGKMIAENIALPKDFEEEWITETYKDLVRLLFRLNTELDTELLKQ